MLLLIILSLSIDVLSFDVISTFFFVLLLLFNELNAENNLSSNTCILSFNSELCCLYCIRSALTPLNFECNVVISVALARSKFCFKIKFSYFNLFNFDKTFLYSSFFEYKLLLVILIVSE